MGFLKCKFSYGFLMKFSGVMEYWMEVLKTERGCNGVGEKTVGFPETSLGFTFNGAVTVGSI